MMESKEKQQFWAEFIDVYKLHPILWRRNRGVLRLKRKAYSELTEKLTELFPTADFDMAKEKIRNLRKYYRREEKKMYEQENGSDAEDEEYECYYFKLLSFLDWEKSEEPSTEEVGPDDAKSRGKTHESDREPERGRNCRCDIGSGEVPCKPQPLSQSKPQVLGQEDEAVVLGKCWTFQFQSLTEDQRMYAQKAISDIFFEAKLGLLRRNSVKIN